jgi:hypothetical protein
MAELIQSSHYKVGVVEDTPRRDPPKTIGVIRGDVANETGSNGFHRILGLSETKWYLYESVEYLRQYNDRSGTGVLNVATIKGEFSRKKDAVSKAESRYNL